MTLAPEVIKELNSPLDPSRIHVRDGGGGRTLSYLEGHDIIRTANNVFGFGGWGYEVQTLECVGSEQVEKTYNGQTKVGWRVAYRATVRVDAGGVIYSDVGYGDAVEYTGSALTPHELASKEAVTDGLKRALKNLGDQFGLCLYDKTYVPGKVSDARGSLPGAATGQGAAGDGPAAPTSGFTWASGKHAGKTLADTPDDYIGWYAAQGPKQDVRAICEAWLAAPAGEQAIQEELIAAGGGEFLDDDVPFDRTTF